MTRGIVKLLVLGFAGISGVATIGGIILKSFNSKETTKQEIITPIKYTNSNKTRKYNIDGSIDGKATTECRIYWVEGVTFNTETSELGFDKLKGEYDNRDKFFNEANILSDGKSITDGTFSLVCEQSDDTGYYYLWKEETMSNEWVRKKEES